MKRVPHSRAFTLIELLIVVGIIALLLSLVLTSIYRIGGDSRKVACATNLKQIVTAIQHYQQKSNGVLFNFNPDKTYIDYTQPGVQQQSLSYCPEVKKPDLDLIAEENASGQIITDPQKIILPGSAKLPWKKQRTEGGKVYYGTYGVNGFLYNRGNEHQGGVNFAYGSANPLTKSYPQPWYPGLAAEHASRVPVIADAITPHAWPNHDDTFPDSLYRGNPDRRYGAHMGRFITNRHGEMTNIAYADGNVDMVSHQGLWTKKWHQLFNTE